MAGALAVKLQSMPDVREPPFKTFTKGVHPLAPGGTRTKFSPRGVYPSSWYTKYLVHNVLSCTLAYQVLVIPSAWYTNPPSPGPLIRVRGEDSISLYPGPVGSCSA